MATTTERPSAAEMRAATRARVEEEQAKLAAARERAARETADEAAAVPASSNGHGSGVDAQEGLFDTVIENDDLVKALEKRETARVARSEANLAYKEVDDQAKGIIATLDVEDGATIRVGRFRITKSHIDSRAVAFETEATTRLNIGVVDD